jgi:hypothetical protein
MARVVILLAVEEVVYVVERASFSLQNALYANTMPHALAFSVLEGIGYLLPLSGGVDLLNLWVGPDLSRMYISDRDSQETQSLEDALWMIPDSIILIEQSAVSNFVEAATGSGTDLFIFELNERMSIAGNILARN